MTLVHNQMKETTMKETTMSDIDTATPAVDTTAPPPVVTGHPVELALQDTTTLSRAILTTKGNVPCQM